MSEDFRPQYPHLLIYGGHFKRRMIGGKSYNGCVLRRDRDGRELLVKTLFGKDWKNNRPFRTATDADSYAVSVVKRYGQLVQAKIMDMMSKNVEAIG